MEETRDNIAWVTSSVKVADQRVIWVVVSEMG